MIVLKFILFGIAVKTLNGNDVNLMNCVKNEGAATVISNPPKQEGGDMLGDIMLTDDDAKQLCNSFISKNPSRKRKKRGIILRSDNQKWTNGIIPYDFDGTHDSFQEGVIRESMQAWSDVTCIRFERQTNTSVQRILFSRTGTQCASFTGRSTQQEQIVNLPNRCFLIGGSDTTVRANGHVLHEIGHVIGLWNEVQRSDRNNHITIDTNELNSQQAFNLLELPFDTFVTTHNTPYSYQSIMHLPQKSYSISGGVTIITNDRRFQSTIGQRVELDLADALVVNRAYCPDRCSGTVGRNCENGGFRNPNACNRCVCRDGFVGDFCELKKSSPSFTGLCQDMNTLMATDEFQTLSTPNYGTGSYPDFSECTWVIESDDSSSMIELSFDGNFGIYSEPEQDVCFHWIEIRLDGINSGERFCGDSSDRLLISTNHRIMILFRSKYSTPGNNVGAQIKYRKSVCSNIRLCENQGTCIPPVCTNNTCTVGATCQCSEGFSGDRCQNSGPANPCQGDPCMNGGSCNSVAPGVQNVISVSRPPFLCICEPGFAGDLCEETLTNPCSNVECANGGSCELQNETAVCICASGFSGPTCETATNPCANSPCENNGTCIASNSTISGYLCICSNSYFQHVYGARCQSTGCDVNPCENGGTCFENDRRRFFSSGPYCVCPPAFAGLWCEKDACASNPCQNGGTCRTTASGYTCECPPGLYGLKCNQIDCTNNPCQNGATCSSASDSYYGRRRWRYSYSQTERCLCRPGYSGFLCEKDPCQTHRCLNNGTCSLADNSRGFTCSCPMHFIGHMCDCVDCSTDPCQNGGQCRYSHCRCSAGFKGPLCETDKCDPNQCKNGGTCIRIRGRAGFRCSCPTGYSGNTCEEIDHCASNPCMNGGTCCPSVYSFFTQTPSSSTPYHCACPSGYTGSHCETDVCSTDVCNGGTCVSDSWSYAGFRCNCPNSLQTPTCTPDFCDSNPCKNGAICSNDRSSFRCSCRSGYLGKDCSQTVCASSPCKNNGSCLLDYYSRDGYSCTCRDGYEGTDCQYQDLCRSNPCQNGASCVSNSFDGHYRCTCVRGYTGRNCDLDICQNNPCQNGGSCTKDLYGYRGYRCSCPSNFFGSQCQYVDQCLSSPCLNNATCRTNSYDGSYSCRCQRGFSGRNCERGVCDSGPCKNNGTCSVNGGYYGYSYKCTCQPEYSGRTCTQRNYCQNQPCMNGGTCQTRSRGYYCRCPNGFTGNNCQTHKCSTTPCKNGGTCIPSTDEYRGYECRCVPGYKGSTCASRDLCVSQPCQNGGVCSSYSYGFYSRFSVSNYRCQCRQGYSGKNCQYDACHSGPCQNGGECQMQPGGYHTCDCPTGFSGSRCQIEDMSRNNPCLNGGRYQSYWGYRDCDCPKEYKGNTCEEKVCKSDTCSTGEECVPTGYGYHYCRCLPGHNCYSNQNFNYYGY